VIYGDDIGWVGVKRAVDEFFWLSVSNIKSLQKMVSKICLFFIS